MITLLKGIIIFALLSACIYTQNDSNVYVVPEVKLQLVEKNEDITYNFENERNLFVVTDSLLLADPHKYKYSVYLGSLKKISVMDGNYGWKTALKAGLAGGILGLAVGIIFAVSIKDPGGVLVPMLTGTGALIFGAIGGILGLATPYYEIYSIKGDLKNKKNEIQKIFKKHKVK